jgi:hypothetical protein
MTYKEQFEIGSIGSDGDSVTVYDGLYTDFISMQINDSEAYCCATYNFSDADEIKKLIIILIKALIMHSTNNYERKHTND